ncbi:MAG: hypothetical protein IPK26_26370 [Planctomycetes bacterium]|nr:hypothetical protein [Planctomycetota bacterium]
MASKNSNPLAELSDAQLQLLLDSLRLDPTGQEHKFYSWRPYHNKSDGKESFQHKVLRCDAKNINVISANRAGKTQGGARLVAARLLGFDPFYDGLHHPLKRTYKVPQFWWACTEPERVKDNFDTLLSFIPDQEIVRVSNKPQHQRVELRNGSWAQMKSYGMKRRAFQGAALYGVWNDEEEPEFINAEQLMRLVDHNGILLRTMTPVEGTTWLYDGPLYGLGDTPKGKKCFEKQRGPMAWFTGKMRDNPYLTEEAIQLRIEEAGMDEDEILIRIEGQYRVLCGENAFGSDNLAWAFSTCREPVAFGTFNQEGLLVESRADSEYVFRVWKPATEGHAYAIGVDPAKGGENSDDSVIVVKDVLTGEDVAVFAGRTDVNNLAQLIFGAGKHYNDALLVVEMNAGWGQSVNTAIRRLHYPEHRIYRRQSQSRSNPELDSFGWMTTQTTKPGMVHDLKHGLLNRVCVVRDEDTVQQMQSFVQLKKHQPGYHGFGPSSRKKKDDRVMAQALAWQGCKQIGVYTTDAPSMRGRDAAFAFRERQLERQRALVEDDFEIDFDEWFR